MRGIIFVGLSIALLLYVLYQMRIGVVFTKSGDTSPSFGWPFWVVEVVAAVVGFLRGIKFLTTPGN